MRLHAVAGGCVELLGAQGIVSLCITSMHAIVVVSSNHRRQMYRRYTGSATIKIAAPATRAAIVMSATSGTVDLGLRA